MFSSVATVRLDLAETIQPLGAPEAEQIRQEMIDELTERDPE